MCVHVRRRVVLVLFLIGFISLSVAVCPSFYMLGYSVPQDSSTIFSLWKAVICLELISEPSHQFPPEWAGGIAWALDFS